MMSKKTTKKPFDELISALQKSIRRGLEYQAMYFATEMEEMNPTVLWDRLEIIASEDIGLANLSMITLVHRLREQYEYFRKKDVERKKKGRKERKEYRLFLSHAILVLSRSTKSRMVDEFIAVVYGARKEGKILPIPDYALDMHTKRGRKMKRGIKHFLKVGAKLENESKTTPNPYKKRAKQLWVKYKGKI